MNLYTLSLIAPKKLYDFLFSDNYLGLPTNKEVNPKQYIETVGDINDLELIILDTHSWLEQGNHEDESPLANFFMIHSYMNASYGLFHHTEVKHHLSDHSFTQLYPNLYRTMEVWVWG